MPGSRSTSPERNSQNNQNQPDTSRYNCVSQLAATIIQKIQHPCEFRDEECSYKGHVNDISFHEANCPFRLVKCPHWACDEKVTVKNMTHHVIASECGDVWDKALPYREAMAAGDPISS